MTSKAILAPVRTSERKCGRALPWTFLGSLALFLATTTAGRAQEMSHSLAMRLHNLSATSREAVGRECGALLKLIDGAEVLTPQQRASGLDRLRDACSQRLAWTNPLLARIAERSVARRRVLESETPAALCQALRVLGLSYHYLARVDEAHRLYQEAVAVSRRWRGRGTTDEDVAASLDSLSSLLLDRGEFPKALELAEESLRLRRQAEPFSPQKVMTALTVRARVEERFNLETAEATLLEALRLGRERCPECPETSRVASNLGEVLYRRGELPRAVTLLQEAEKLRLRDSRSGRPLRQLAATQLLLGHVLYDLGD